MTLSGKRTVFLYKGGRLREEDFECKTTASRLFPPCSVGGGPCLREKGVERKTAVSRLFLRGAWLDVRPSGQPRRLQG